MFFCSFSAAAHLPAVVAAVVAAAVVAAVVDDVVPAVVLFAVFTPGVSLIWAIAIWICGSTLTAMNGYCAYCASFITVSTVGAMPTPSKEPPFISWYSPTDSRMDEPSELSVNAS